PVSSGNADLELAGDQATDAAALVTVRQRLAAGSEVDAVATHQVLAGLVEGEQGRVEQATGDACGGGGVAHGARPAQELVAKDRRTMHTRDQRTAAHAVPGGIDGDVSPAPTVVTKILPART